MYPSHACQIPTAPVAGGEYKCTCGKVWKGVVMWLADVVSESVTITAPVNAATVTVPGWRTSAVTGTYVGK